MISVDDVQRTLSAALAEVDSVVVDGLAQLGDGEVVLLADALVLVNERSTALLGHVLNAGQERLVAARLPARERFSARAPIAPVSLAALIDER